MRKKLIAGMMSVIMSAALLAGCGASTDTATDAGDNTTTEAAAESTETATAEAGAEYKIAIIQYMDHASLNQITKNVEAELDAKGAELGVTFNYADYTFNGEGDATTLNQIAAQVISDEVDAIVCVATPTAQIAQAADEDAGIPIIFSAVTDPVGAGLVASFDAPGANITGTSDALNTDAIMNLILAQNPETTKVGLLYSKSEDSSTQAIADAKAFLDEKGIAYVEKTGTATDEINQAVDALVADGVDAVFTPTDNTIMNAELAIYEKFIDAGIPHYTGADSFALNGAFLGFGINYEDLGRETADMVVEVVANGQDPATLAVRTLDNGIATVNTDTAAALGIDLETIKEAFAPYCSEIVETTTAEEFE